MFFNFFIEYQVGEGRSPLFTFHNTGRYERRGWQNQAAERDHFKLRLEQNRNASGSDNVGQELVEALHSVINEHLNSTERLQPHHYVHFTLQSKAFSHAFQSTEFTVREFREGSLRLDNYLQSLARKLNSNEEFTPEQDFDAAMTVVRLPGRGAGKKGKKTRIGYTIVEDMLRTKRSIVRIKNTDELCCARALVTMIAWHGKKLNRTSKNQYDSMVKGCPLQLTRARELHLLAGVPEGPCGIEELKQFQMVLTDYQIKVLSYDRPHCLIFKGPEDKEKKLLLIKVDDHFHGCTSFPGFFNRSYYCHLCDKAYSCEDNHHCVGVNRKCTCCERRDCPDKTSSSTVTCDVCGCGFKGATCLTNHKQQPKPTQRSLCQRYRTCQSCKKKYVLASKEIRNGTRFNRHKCHHDICLYCDCEVDLSTHRCYIQPVKASEDKPKTKVVPLEDVGTRTIVRIDEAEGKAEGKAEVQKPPPLFVYGDFEAVTDAEGNQSPILVCLQREDEDQGVHYYGNTCVEGMMEYLEELTTDENDDERQVICVFHNFKGYDGMFVLQYLYKHKQDVTFQINVGTKVLSLSTGNIKFIDSCCFLPFPLAQFPDTFGLQELTKGFFPHKFNTLENQTYEGPMPPKEDYDPLSMTAKNSAAFERWYDQKIRENYQFILQDEMLAYCRSDVQLLKEECQCFQQEFKRHADFNPMEKTVTIASACHRFWRKKCYHVNRLPSNHFAVGMVIPLSNLSKLDNG